MRHAKLLIYVNIYTSTSINIYIYSCSSIYIYIHTCCATPGRIWCRLGNGWVWESLQLRVTQRFWCTHTYIYTPFLRVYIYIASLSAKAYGPIHARDPHGQIWVPEKDELPICGKEFYNHTARAESDWKKCVWSWYIYMIYIYTYIYII